MSWLGATASWHYRAEPGGSRSRDDLLVRNYAHDIGAEMMGRNRFGPQRGRRRHPLLAEVTTGDRAKMPPMLRRSPRS